MRSYGRSQRLLHRWGLDGHPVTSATLVLALGCATSGAETAADGTEHAATVPDRELCMADLEEAERLVRENYAGYEDKRRALGEARLAEALAQARARALAAGSSAECLDVLRQWLAVFHDGHLQVLSTDRSASPSSDHASPEPEPRLELHDHGVVYLRIPSFAPSQEAAIASLLREHRGRLQEGRVLIVDVRGNSGGSDSAYRELMSYVSSGPYSMVGADVLATATNADAWARIVEQIPQEAADKRAELQAIIEEMRGAHGRYVSLVDDQKVEPEPIPSSLEHVAVFYDRGCASSCEQFLLAARQSTKVTLYGESSAGVLDYANVRYQELSSGKRVLLWPTSRSRRLPEAPVDGVGIAPDVRLAPEALHGLEVEGMIGVVEDAMPLARSKASAPRGG